MKLLEMADIYAGYLFRSRIEPVKNGPYKVIQMKDITRDDAIKWENLIRVELDSVRSAFLLEQGDILFKAKGSSHSAILVGRTEDNTIASSFFFIIRTHRASVLPGYVAWYLNQKPAQQYFARFAAGTGIRHINRRSLGDLPKDVPDMDTQRKIVELHRLSQREKNLVGEIQGKRQTLITAVMLDAIRHQNANV